MMSSATGRIRTVRWAAAAVIAVLLSWPALPSVSGAAIDRSITVPLPNVRDNFEHGFRFYVYMDCRQQRSI